MLHLMAVASGKAGAAPVVFVSYVVVSVGTGMLTTHDDDTISNGPSGTLKPLPQLVAIAKNKALGAPKLLISSVGYPVRT